MPSFVNCVRTECATLKSGLLGTSAFILWFRDEIVFIDIDIELIGDCLSKATNELFDSAGDDGKC